MRSLTRLATAAAAVAVALPAAAQATPTVATEPCPDLEPDARCGHVDVLLDRRAPHGAKVPISFVVLPHTDSGQAPLEPVFIIKGGPGDAASAETFLGAHHFAGVRDRRDVVMVDYRGEGRSGAIDCPDFQHLETDVIDELIAAAGTCGAQLGDNSDRYGAADVADDVDAVRAALGYDAINLYGLSYGTVQAQAYALRHGERLRSLILDGAMSPLDVAGNWEIGISNARAVAGDVAIVCSRSPSCSRHDRDPARTFAALVRRVREHPVDGVGRDVTGTDHDIHVDEGRLIRIATAVGGPYLNDGELVAAADALRRGDAVPLLRLAANTQGPLITDPGVPADLSSAGLNAAAQCTDFPVPWDLSASFAQRRAQFDAAMARIPFGPFSPAAWAANGGFSGYCLQWPAPDNVTPVFTRDARFPRVPALVVAATLDTSTTLEQSRFVARLFPGAQMVVLRNGGHVPSWHARCVPDILARFVDALDAGDTSCVLDDDPDRPAVGTFPQRIADAPAADRRPGDQSRGDQRRIASVAWGAVQDALRQSLRLDGLQGTGAGLRGGTFDSSFDFPNRLMELDLHGVRFSEDVVVDGHVKVDHGDLTGTVTVDGPGRSDGTISLGGRSFTFDKAGGVIRLDGRLGDRTIALSTPAD
jgi:pimeloyl-ACP methyl ester carboxylesterase